MSDTTWIRLGPGVVAEVEYDRFEYEMGGVDSVPGRLTGVVRMTKAAVLDGMFGLAADDETERPAGSEETTT